MREVTLKGLDQATSCLGFGCASLGSRVSAADGTRALALAYAQGVRWFDVAPAYGAGAAEPILGAFLKDRRDSVQICTKVGLVPPPQGGAIRLARRLLRPAVALARPLRAAIRKTGATANRGVPLSADLLRRSLEQSLTRLSTDHVEVYALHNPDPADLRREDILRALEDLRAAGKAQSIAVAGTDAATAAALAQGAPFDLIQMPQPAGAQGVQDIEAAGMGCITHTVFGVAGQLAVLTGILKRDASLRARMAQAGFDGTPETAAAALLLARAFACNPQGVVLASMFSARSLSANLAAAMGPAHSAATALYHEAMN